MNDEIFTIPEISDLFRDEFIPISKFQVHGSTIILHLETSLVFINVDFESS